MTTTPYTTLHNAIRSIVKTGIADTGTLVAYENQKFSPDDLSVPWVAFTVESTAGVAASFGAGQRIRHVGAWVAEINVPVTTGDKGANIIADKIYNLFVSKKISGILFRVPAKVTHGIVDGWWQQLMSCSFQYDEIIPSAA